jgi:hypothetical protein
MAHDEACQLFIKQEIERGLQEGKKPWTIGKELSAWVEKLFEVNIPHRTLESQAKRQRNKITSNDVTHATTENNSEKGEKPSIKREEGGKFSEGTQGGPGRPPKYEIKQRYSCAEQMVELAIDHLSRIPSDDPKRSWAREEMLYWVENNL